MTSYNPPAKGVELIFYVGLYAQSDDQLLANPTIAAGDFKVSKDGGAFANPATLPAVTPASGIGVKVVLSTTEMNADNVYVYWKDASGDEWHSNFVNIHTVASGQQFDDLSTFDDTTDTVDVGKISGDATAANNAESFFDGTGYAGTNNVIPTVTDVTNQVTADTTAISGDTTAANNAESFFDGTGYAGTNNVIPTVTDVTNQVTADVTAVSGDTGAADNLEADYDGTGYAKTNSTVGTVTDVTNQVTADTTAISGDSTAADNLEATYDGTGYTDDSAPATQSQIGNLTSGTAAINTTAESFTKAGAEPETLTYTATTQEDGSYHVVEDDATSTDAYYQFDVGGNGVPVSVTWTGYAQSNGDSYTIHAYNYDGTAYEQIGTITALNGTTPVTNTYSLTNAHVGTGANLGKVRFRFLSADGTAFATDRLLCSYAVVSKSVGYAQGAIWVDTGASNTNTEAYVDGVADNPVSTWAAALTLNTTLGLNRFRVHGGSSITLTGDSTGYSIIGDGLITLALGGQTITNAHIENADVSGTGAGSGVTWRNCEFDNSVAIPPSTLLYCGIKSASGTPLTANGAGEYVLVDCVSLVAGSGTPYLDFSGTGGASGINIRRWAGGINVTLDTNNTLSHEVMAGGGTTITTGGASCEIRGTTRALTVAMSAAETVQFVGVTGPISLSGTTTATVNLHGISTSLTDTTSAATVNDNTVSQDNVNAEVDTALTDIKLDHLVAVADSDDAVDNSIIAKLAASDGDWSGYSAATDSLEAIRDRGDAAWTTGAGGSAPTVEEIRTEMDDNSTQLAAIVGDTNELQIAWTDGGRLDLIVDAILADTNELQTDDVPGLIAALENLSAADVNTQVDAAFTTQMADSVPADGTIPTREQAIYMIIQWLTERAVADTTVTVKKVDGSTSLMTFTLDDGTSPTSITRAT